ncbi:g4435 [Coccomyxa elongata]
MLAVERDLVPDFIIRRGIRYLLSQRVQEAREGGVEEQERRKQTFVRELKGLPIAVQTSKANEQHYEVPSDYFLLVLGQHLKYSSCLYPSSSTTLDEAEEAMLGLCCERAQLLDGQAILELGCGWGSMCLYMAAKFPKSNVTAVSNSTTQKALIDERAKERGISNLTVITEDVVKFDTKQKFDRVVSIEMFEHMKNYQALLKNIAGWLKPEGLLFVHIFTHKTLAYHFEVKGEDDWMAKYFFTGGTMPSADLLHHFQDDLALQQQWAINGTHYSRTLEDWLKRQDKQRAAIMPIMEKTYGKDQGLRWWVYWRLFYLACSELFNYNGGEEWFVSHYLFRK